MIMYGVIGESGYTVDLVGDDVPVGYVQVYSERPEGDYIINDQGEWILRVKTEDEMIRDIQDKQAKLMAMATDKINPLQDAVDLDMANDQEKASLTEWKKYRVLLNRIESQPNYPQQIDWPQEPDK